MEQRFTHPFSRWMDERVVQPRAVAETLDLLQQAARSGAPTLLFGSLTQLHALSHKLQSEGYGADGRTLELPPGSLAGTGGGLKELYPFTPDQIRQDIQQARLMLAEKYS